MKNLNKSEQSVNEIAEQGLAPKTVNNTLPKVSSDIQVKAAVVNPSDNVSNMPFHDTKGTIDVNSNGQLQYLLPIALPPGIKTVAPQINLQYNSGSGNGIAGYGWTISGITSISRMGRTIDKDGEIRAIQFDYADYYMFNGQRLILKSGAYGKDAAEYVTEKYSNIKIKSVGQNVEKNGPAYFEVTFEDGSQAWYGLNADARTQMEYNIVKWIDPQGNAILYSYIQGNNVAVIDRIDWGGNETLGTAHFNSITFTYLSRALRETSYMRGKLFVQTNLLSTIQVKANGTIFKTYNMAYEKDNKGNHYQFLKSITELNSKGEAATPVIFDYKKSVAGGWKQTWITNDSAPDLLYGDFDGDGKIDIIKYVDAFQECLKYEEVYHPGGGTSGDNDSQAGYWESVCTQPVSHPAGIYHFGSVFDDERPKQVLVGSMLTREQLKSATVITLKNAAGELLSQQGFCIYQPIPSTTSSAPDRFDLLIKGFSLVMESGNKQLKEEFVLTIPADVYDQTVLRDSGNTQVSQYWHNTLILGVKELDIDGDGLSELIFTIRDVSSSLEVDGDKEPKLTKETRYSYLVVKPGQTDLAKLARIIRIDSPLDNFFGGTVLQGDFNGDGSVDFITFDSLGKPNLTVFKKNAAGDYMPNTSLYANVVIEGLRHRAVVGDFTGDGKTDLLVPQAIDSRQWKLYISTGAGFKVQNLPNFELYKENLTFNGKTHSRFINRQYFVQDLNKDGKADFIAFYSHILADNSDGTTTKFMILYHENKGMDANGNVVFVPTNIDGSTLKGRSSYKMDWYPAEYNNYWTEVKGYASFSAPRNAPLAHFSPLVGDFKINNFNENILVFRQGRLVKYAHYNVADESYITSINQGGIITEIKYAELDPKVSPGFYAGTKKELYPYVELERMSRTFVVSQLKQGNRKQDFKYRGFVTNVLGKGMIGFRKSARSTWYTDLLKATKIWSGVEIDPLNEGLPIKEWSVRTLTDDNLIFPVDLSVSNTKLLSFKSIEYKRTTPSKGVTAIVPIKIVSKDFLKNIVEENTVTYGDYLLPATTTSTINTNFSTVNTVLTYSHNPSGLGKEYYIGHPISKVETVNAYADVRSIKEEYSYTGNLLSSKKVYNKSNTAWIQEGYTYDGFGNVTKKIVTNSVDTLTETEQAQYDPKGRFVIKKTDNLGLTTVITYNDWGLVLTQTDPLGDKITNTYDGWGKTLSAKTTLGGTTTFTYEKMDDGGTKISEFQPTGMTIATFINKLGQEVKVRKRGFNREGYIIEGGDVDVWIEGDKDTRLSVLTTYDELGRKVQESEPHRDGFEPKWNTISYNDSVFPSIATATSFYGKQIRTRQSGRVTLIEEMNGYLRTSKKTTDALGNVIISEDKGGIINFTFNASGQQLSAKYGTNIVKTEYDAWGRKSKFDDPSNGIYSYTYNGLGQLTKETSPKGYKEYRYNTKGQLTQQIEKSTVVGLTDKVINYAYNTKGQLLTQSGTSKGKTFKITSTYDTYGRLMTKTEESYGRIYAQREILYDDKSRVISYVKSLKSGTVETIAAIQHVYEEWSGLLQKIVNKTTGEDLWRRQENSASGKIVRARLGYTNIKNTYDEQDFLKNTQQGILNAEYTFDAMRNELKERIRSGNINLTETFTYDGNNRLIDWTDPKTGGRSSNVYDIQGRITTIDNIGTVRFDNAAKIYRPSSVKLSTDGKQSYGSDLIQQTVYNENNDPIYISGQQADVRFGYGLGDMRQMVSYGGKGAGAEIDNAANSQWEGQYTKYYSADGGFEVVRNNSTGQEKHLIYIGSSPYESNIVYLKDYSESSGFYRFLHKDYLGSILAISDAGGTLLEQRHFDAWGNLTHGNMQLLDRGYTSHEHFAMVGIIHMNGRLFDPRLRRFLNADEHIQDMFNTQNYNKYGYVLNNPMMYNDPSGEFFFGLLAIPLIKAIFIGAAVGLAAYTVGLAVSGNIGMWNLGGALKATLFGAVSGAVTFGIGSIFKAAANTIGNALLQAGAHGASQGVLGLVQGQNFFSAAAAGLFGSLGAYGWGRAMNGLGLGQFSQSTYGMIGFGAISGGVGAELTGGNFWQGVITGGVVSGLNHVMHKIGGPDDPKDKEQITKKKVRIKITRDIYDQLKKVDDVIVKSILDGKSMFGKYGTVLDFLDAGGEIYLVNLEYKEGVLTKAEYQFKMANTVLNKGASLGAGLALEAGFTMGSRAGIYGMLVGTAVGATVDGAFYISAKGEQWLNKWGRYIRYQTIGIIENSIR